MSVTTAAPALPDDIIGDILVQLNDAAALFRCAAACKPWLRLVADPAFLRRCRWPDGGGPSLLGFLVQRVTAGNNTPAVTAFVPAPGSALGPARRRLTSFVRDDGAAGILVDQAKPLAAHDGLLLVRLPPRSGDRNRGLRLRLCVCNLLTGRRDLLPPLDATGLDGDEVRGYAVLTAADVHGAAAAAPAADGYSIFFRVILIGVTQDGGGRLLLFTFSSAAAAASMGWSSYDSNVLIPEHLQGPYGCRVAAVARGAAHWLFLGASHSRRRPALHLFSVSIDMERVGVTEIALSCWGQLRDNEECKAWLCTDADARLSILCGNIGNILVWTRKDDGDQSGTVGWHITQRPPVHGGGGMDGLNLFKRMLPLPIACVGEKTGTMLSRHDGLLPDCAYVQDLKSGSTTRVQGWERSFNYGTAVPYEINSWPEFFMSRLGSLL